MRLKNVQDVVAWRLCLGCGACVPACPEEALTLIDIEHDGLRPRADASKCAHCGRCIQVCPGVSVDKDAELPIADCGLRIGPPHPPAPISELHTAWGTVLEIWEGYAADPEVRFCGSSGGLATALALFCLERQQRKGVLHIGPSTENPLANVPVVSSNRAELLLRTGSRYAPAAPCLGLPASSADSQSYVFIGKPCDVAAVRKWQQRTEDGGQRTEDGAVIRHPSSVIRSFGLLISIFCAGTPSAQGTKKILEKLSVKPDEVAELRYRGRGWPGRTVVTLKQDSGCRPEAVGTPPVSGLSPAPSMTYQDSWGTILSKHTQFRCRLCPDGTGELADISCGDPWYREIEPNEPGRSLVLVRTEAGRRILHEAMEAGYVRLERAEPDTLPRSQESLLQKRRELWGRLLALCLTRVPVPCYCGFSLFRNWQSLPLKGKLRSVLGTLHRIAKRKWYKRLRDL